MSLTKSERADLLRRYTEACNYPGLLDEQAVDGHLRRYVAALGITRDVKRLGSGWSVYEEPALLRSINATLDDFAKCSGRSRDALDARAARDALAALDARDALDALDARAARAARDARDARAALAARDALAALDARAARDALDALDGALQRFASWCANRAWWWHAEVSWSSTTYLGAVQLDETNVIAWSEPLFQAYLAGAWVLFWTEDTLYWFAKPTVHMEQMPGGGKRFHNDSYAALESDIENLYFWHGVLVPAFVIVNPEWITVKHIQTEENVEVRRVMMERMGFARYLEQSGAQLIHSDEMGDLYRSEVPGDEPLVMVRVLNSTEEADGSRKPYYLRVPPTVTTAREAVAWTFDMTPDQYARHLRQQT